jgi:hypothetical protein
MPRAFGNTAVLKSGKWLSKDGLAPAPTRDSTCGLRTFKRLAQKNRHSSLQSLLTRVRQLKGSRFDQCRIASPGHCAQAAMRFALLTNTLLHQSASKIRRPFCKKRQSANRAPRVPPKTSLNHRTRYGGPSWPGLGYAVHSPNPGQAVPPRRSG